MLNLFKITWAVLVLLVLYLATADGAPGRSVQTRIVPLAEGVSVVERGSNSARKYGYNGASLVGNHGELRGWRDAQFGHWDPARPSQVNGDIGAGSTEHPGILNIGADVSRAVRIQASGITVLRAESGRIKVCDRQGCLDLMKALRAPRR